MALIKTPVEPNLVIHVIKSFKQYLKSNRFIKTHCIEIPCNSLMITQCTRLTPVAVNSVLDLGDSVLLFGNFQVSIQNAIIWNQRVETPKRLIELRSTGIVVWLLCKFSVVCIKEKRTEYSCIHFFTSFSNHWYEHPNDSVIQIWQFRLLCKEEMFCKKKMQKFKKINEVEEEA